MKIMPMISASAVQYKQKQQSNVDFEGKIKLPSKLPAKSWLMGGVAAVLFSLGVTTGCSMKDNNITGLDKTNETELYTHAPVRDQVPVFNNHPVGQRFLDWYGNHLGIAIPQNRPITGFKYLCTADQKWHENILIKADDEGFYLLDKTINNYGTDYVLHRYSIQGEELHDSFSMSCMQGYNPFDPESPWSPPSDYIEYLGSVGLSRATASNNLLLTLAPLSEHRLRMLFPSGTQFEYQNFSFTTKNGGAVPRNDRAPMAR